MSLYRKYRPQTFEDVMGNDAELNSLKKTLDKENKPHTYLLSGPSGCGKTTLARIAAAHIGGSELSIHELNTSDNRGIDTARDIIENMKFAPMDGSPKIYIIDEVHKTTNEWQNAMLKPLEDTPEHVYFFLCTTNPEKLIKAIHTRCTSFKVKNLSADELFPLLRKINKAESGNIPWDILEEISENSEGSPRQALQILEKVMEMDDPKQMMKVVHGFTEEENNEAIDLCRILLKAKTWGEITAVLNNLKDVDVEKIRYAVLGFMNSVLLKSQNNAAAAVIDCFSEPFYNSGRAGLTLACYESTFGE